MGSCVSLHQRESESAMKLGLSVESKNQSLIVPSPVKQNSVAVNGQDHAVADFDAKSQRSLPHFRSDGNFVFYSSSMNYAPSLINCFFFFCDLIFILKFGRV